ncbi:MAG: hypothetical protein KF836_06310 [Fimbriimonadaceae bacterium]|nr:hypothetical protein [Fimbriimonadaceae bacterium]
MALSRTYLTVNGQIRSEHRSGETQSRDYMHDALGSVVVVYQNNSFVADGSYSCLGRLESGSWNIAAQGYKFAWNGGHGYRQTGVEWSSTYVRARHYSFMDGGWTTIDPLWPFQMPYGYVKGRSMSRVDPSGMLGCRVTKSQKETNCGSHRFTNQWKLDPSERIGWIVQHVKVRGEFKDCDGNPPNPVPKIDREYWEAWKVSPSLPSQRNNPRISTCKTDVTSDLDHDTFLTPDVGFCRSGKITIVGKVKFVHILDEDIDMSNFKCLKGGPPPAGWLWFNPDWPIGWEDTGTITKSLEVTFSCCCRDECKSGTAMEQTATTKCR